LPLGTICASAHFVDGPASTCLSAGLGPGPPFGDEHRPFERGWARYGTVFPVSVVAKAAAPAAVCRWGRRPRCAGVGRCLSGVS